MPGYEDKKFLEGLIETAIAGVLGASANAFYRAYHGDLKKAAAHFLGGFFLSLLVAMIFSDLGSARWWKMLACGTCGAFGSTLWPLFEAIASTAVKKKGGKLIGADEAEIETPGKT